MMNMDDLIDQVIKEAKIAFDSYEDTIKELEQQLAVYKKSEESFNKLMVWQPIESAPKDGTEIDLYFDKGTGNEGFRIADCAWSGDGWCSGNVTDSHGFEQRLDSYNPTQWRPLPKPPKDGE